MDGNEVAAQTVPLRIAYKTTPYGEEYMQEFLIKIELVENHLKELRARYPSIEDDNKEEERKDNGFDEHGPALKDRTDP